MKTVFCGLAAAMFASASSGDLSAFYADKPKCAAGWGRCCTADMESGLGSICLSEDRPTSRYACCEPYETCCPAGPDVFGFDYLTICAQPDEKCGDGSIKDVDGTYSPIPLTDDEVQAKLDDNDCHNCCLLQGDLQVWEIRGAQRECLREIALGFGSSICCGRNQKCVEGSSTGLWECENVARDDWSSGFGFWLLQEATRSG